MKNMGWLMAAVVLAGALGVSLVSMAADDSKITVKVVMKEAMKDMLCKKAAMGGANDAEKARLVELFTAMCAAKPKKGDEASWKEKTEALLKAATDLKAGKDGAGAALGMAANCKSCHDAHK